MAGTLKSVSGKMKLDLAQYRELAVFAQFGSELDPSTMALLERGKRATEILKQPQYQPLPEALQIISMWTVNNGFLDDVPVEQVSKFEKEFHEYLKNRHAKLIVELSNGEKPTANTLEQVKKAIEAFKKIFIASNAA